jgi:serine/threonine protein kinase
VRKRVGKYILREPIGEGGMGIVYAAEDVGLGRQVAIKMLRESERTELSRKRMWREARAAAAINHPNICQVYEIGEHQGEVFLAMELLEGEPLSDRMARGAMPPAEALAVVREILDGLGAMHNQGFLHRDLKPSNVFLTERGVKLLDFGLALPLPEGLVDSDNRLTKTGFLVGTPAFMAPEQWDGSVVGPPCDLFAVGALLFEMLAGEPAFKGAGPMGVYHAILHEHAPALVGGTSVAMLDRIVQRALEKSPEKRFASAADMARAVSSAESVCGKAETPRVRKVKRILTIPFDCSQDEDDLEFLRFGIPDAVASSLAQIESLLVRSGKNADDADVDFVLAGRLQRAGERLRVTVQLQRGGDRSVVSSESVDASWGEVFQLQDELAGRIADALSITLTAEDKRGLRRARASTPEAQEHYLRANALANNTGMLGAARNLYLSCLEIDPEFAPAWARLGRTYRVMAKYGHGDPQAGYAQAEEAFRKALELSPELSIAHNLFTYFEIEQLSDAPKAMSRLLHQIAHAPADPELLSGLVVACRFCGLFEASVAAHQRARRLDPGIRTSVAYTFFHQGDYEQAIAHDDEDRRYVAMNSLPMLGRVDEALEMCRELEHSARNTLESNFAVTKRAALEGDLDTCTKASLQLFESRFEDPEGLLYIVRDLAYVGATDQSLEVLQWVVRRGFHVPETLERDPWLESLRNRPEFRVALDGARSGHEMARAEYLQASGERLLVR